MHLARTKVALQPQDRLEFTLPVATRRCRGLLFFLPRLAAAFALCGGFVYLT